MTSQDPIEILAKKHGLQKEDIKQIWDGKGGNIQAVEKELQKMSGEGRAVKFRFRAKTTGVEGAGYFEMNPSSTSPQKFICNLIQPGNFQSAKPSLPLASFLDILITSTLSSENRIAKAIQCDLQKKISNHKDLLFLSMNPQPSQSLGPLLIEALEKILGDAKIVCEVQSESVKIEAAEEAPSLTKESGDDTPNENVLFEVGYVLSPVQGVPVSRLKIHSMIYITFKKLEDLQTKLKGKIDPMTYFQGGSRLPAKILQKQFDQEAGLYRILLSIDGETQAVMNCRGDVNIAVPSQKNSGESEAEARITAKVEKKMFAKAMDYYILIFIGIAVIAIFFLILLWYFR